MLSEQADHCEKAPRSCESTAGRRSLFSLSLFWECQPAERVAMLRPCCDLGNYTIAACTKSQYVCILP